MTSATPRNSKALILARKYRHLSSGARQTLKGGELNTNSRLISVFGFSSLFVVLWVWQNFLQSILFALYCHGVCFLLCLVFLATRNPKRGDASRGPLLRESLRCATGERNNSPMQQEARKTDTRISAGSLRGSAAFLAVFFRAFPRYMHSF